MSGEITIGDILSKLYLGIWPQYYTNSEFRCEYTTTDAPRRKKADSSEKKSAPRRRPVTIGGCYNNVVTKFVEAVLNVTNAYLKINPAGLKSDADYEQLYKMDGGYLVEFIRNVVKNVVPDMMQPNVDMVTAAELNSNICQGRLPGGVAIMLVVFMRIMLTFSVCNFKSHVGPQRVIHNLRSPEFESSLNLLSFVYCSKNRNLDDQNRFKHQIALIKKIIVIDDSVSDVINSMVRDTSAGDESLEDVFNSMTIGVKGEQNVTTAQGVVEKGTTVFDDGKDIFVKADTTQPQTDSSILTSLAESTDISFD